MKIVIVYLVKILLMIVDAIGIIIPLSILHDVMTRHKRNKEL